MMDISSIILQNEIYRLKSINIDVAINVNGFKVSSLTNTTTDFNFFIPIRNINLTCCNRISDRNNMYYYWQRKLLINNLIPEKVFDINFIALGKKNDKFLNSKYNLKEVNYKTWENSTRNLDERVKFYYITYNGEFIGKMSIVEMDFLVGIYDFEIYQQYRSKHHAANFLKLYIEKLDKIAYIQTWSTNKQAIKSYLVAGFKIYENLYRYNI